MKVLVITKDVHKSEFKQMIIRHEDKVIQKELLRKSIKILPSKFNEEVNQLIVKYGVEYQYR